MPSSKHLPKSTVFNLMARKLMMPQTKALETRYFSMSTEMDFTLQIACFSTQSLLLLMPYKEEHTKACINQNILFVAKIRLPMQQENIL